MLMMVCHTMNYQKKYGLATSTIKYQVRLYLAHGDKAFISKATRKYTREEKLKVIKRHNDGESYGLIAIDNGALITINSMRNNPCYAS